MAYTPNPFDPAQPTGDKPASSAADEFRALKGSYKYTLRFPTSDADSYLGELPGADSRAGKLLAFNATTGKPEAGPTTASIESLVTSATTAADNAAISETNSAASAADAAASAVSAAASATDSAASAASSASSYASAAAIIADLGSPVTVAKGGTGAMDAATARTNLGTNNAANLTTGTLATARLGSGTANSSSILRGDSSWVVSLTQLKSDLAASGSAPVFGCRAWGTVTYAGGVPTLVANGNVTSIADTATGDLKVNFAVAMPSAGYSVVATAASEANTYAGINAGAYSTSQFGLYVRVANTGVLADSGRLNFAVFG